MRYWVSKLCLELIDETLDQPVTIDWIVHNLLHGSTGGEEVLILLILQQQQTDITQTTIRQDQRRFQMSAACTGDDKSGLHRSINRPDLQKLPLLQKIYINIK